MNALNGTTLNEIATATPTAKIVTQKLADRQRLRHVTDISRIRNDLVKDGSRIVDEEYMAYWKQLQNQKIGNIIYGRKGKPNRFEWHYSLKSVAQAALDGKDVQLQKLEPSQLEMPIKPPKVETKRGPGRPKGFSPKKAKATLQAKANVVSETKKTVEQLILVPIQNGMHVQIKVPGGMNAGDIDSVVKALQLLK